MQAVLRLFFVIEFSIGNSYKPSLKPMMILDYLSYLYKYSPPYFSTVINFVG